MSDHQKIVPVSKLIIHRILKDDLKLFHFKIQRKNKLQPADLGKRLLFYQWLLRHRRHDIMFVIHVEAQFRLNGKVCTQNVRCFAPRGNQNAPANVVYETDNNQ